MFNTLQVCTYDARFDSPLPSTRFVQLSDPCCLKSSRYFAISTLCPVAAAACWKTISLGFPEVPNFSDARSYSARSHKNYLCRLASQQQLSGGRAYPFLQYPDFLRYWLCRWFRLSTRPVLKPSYIPITSCELMYYDKCRYDTCFLKKALLKNPPENFVLTSL